MTSKTVLSNVLALLVAAVVAEGIVRIALHPALDYASEFTPGPYCASPTLGVSFACPDRHGVMHALGTNIYLPYTTNDEGYRGPYGASGQRGDINDVVLIGGQSQAWGDGLSDHDTIGAVLARTACAAADIHVFALPGVSTAQSWKLYNLSREAAHPPDQIVMMIYGGLGPDWRRQIDPDTKLLDGPFAILYGWLYPLPQWLEVLSNSYVVVRSADSLRASLSQLMRRAQKGFDDAAARLGFDSAADAPRSQPDTSYQDFIRMVAQQAQRLHSGLSVVFLPGAREVWSVDADSIERDLPELRFIDLDAKAAALGLYPAQTLPDGHYNAELAHFIGSEIGRTLCPTSHATQSRRSTTRVGV